MQTVAVIGSEEFDDDILLQQVLDNTIGVRYPDVVILGTEGSQGTAGLVEEYATSNGIPFVEYITDWEHDGRRAQHIRNRKIISDTDECIVFWDDEDQNLRMFVDLCRRSNVGVRLIPVRKKIKRYNHRTGLESIRMM